MRTLTTLSIITLFIIGCGTPASPPETTEVGIQLELPAGFAEASRSIIEENLLADVTRLASDEFEGRGPGSNGDRSAREFLASRLADIGYGPLFADGSYEQPVEIVGLTSHFPKPWTFNDPDGETVSFSYTNEFMAMAGLQESKIVIDDAEVVFVGYGIVAPEEQWDDFKGVDLSGKILLMLNDDPHWDDELFAGERKLSYGRWDYKYASAARQGAAGAVIIHTTPSAGYPWQVVRSSNIGEQFELASGDEARTRLKGWLTWEASQKLTALAGFDLEELITAARSRDFQPVPLGVTTSIAFDVDVRVTETANVAGILRGSDPEVADEIIVLSAHHDHFGIGEPDSTGDVIYNGALDNGVAMSQALAVAGAFAELPEGPRRSVMVFFPAAEEQGILGSAFFANSGAVHPGRMVTDINFELGNVWGKTKDVIVYGLGKSELDDWLTAAASTQDRTIRAEQDLRAGWFYRSDQISFARIGVPAIWFKSGVDFIGREPGWGETQYADWIQNKYHQPSDEVEDNWVFDGLVEDAQLGFMLAAAVATADVTPTWYEGDEFEATRQEALADLGR